MQISKHKVVTIEYSLKNEKGETLESTQGKAPLSYIQGMENFIPGLEKALEGKTVGDHVTITIPPEEGYGQHDESLVQRLPRKTFDPIVDPQPGMQLPTEMDSETIILTVVGVEGEEVIVDGNHPLVGMTLDFEVTVIDVRDATTEELKQGDVEPQSNKIRPVLS